jgi:hypothetical protein
MAALIFLLLNLGASIFKPKSRLAAENAALRQQLIVLQRQVRGRAQFTQLYRWFPSVLKAMRIMRPETVIRWQRAGFSPLLALEIAQPGWPAEHRRRFAGIDPADEH